MKSSNNYLKQYFIKNIGFGYIDLLTISCEKINSFKITVKRKNLRKYNDLKSIQEEKQKLSIFKNFKKQYLNLSGCNMAKNRFCGSVTCKKCCNQYYLHKLGCNKNNQNVGEFTLKSQLLLQILETRVRTLSWESNIWKKI